MVLFNRVFPREGQGPYFFACPSDAQFHPQKSKKYPFRLRDENLQKRYMGEADSALLFFHRYCENFTR